MKRTIIILVLLVATAGLILATLDRLMGNPNHNTHGFTRTFKNVRLVKGHEFKLNKNFYNIAGTGNDHIYLSNGKAGEILTINIATGSIADQKINLPAIEKLESAFQTIVDYPNIYIAGANARKIIKGNLENYKFDIYNIPTGPLLSAAIVDNENAIIRCIDTVSFEMEFRKMNFITGATEVMQKVAPVKNQDIFAYDGQMHFDSKNNELAYVNYYSNGIARFNTALDKIDRRKSIDTMNAPKVSVAHLEKSVTPDAPPLTVNKHSALYNGMVYIHSALIADNESYHAFSENTVIDTYGNTYAGSFYLPVAASEIKQFSIIDAKRIAVLLSDRLVIYSFN